MGFLLDLVHEGEAAVSDVWHEGTSLVGSAFHEADQLAKDPSIRKSIHELEDAPIVGGLVKQGEGVYHMAHGVSDAANGDYRGAMRQETRGMADYLSGGVKAVEDGASLYGSIEGGGGGGGEGEHEHAQPHEHSNGRRVDEAGKEYGKHGWHQPSEPPRVHRNPVNGRVTPEPPRVERRQAELYDGLY